MLTYPATAHPLQGRVVEGDIFCASLDYRDWLAQWRINQSEKHKFDQHGGLTRVKTLNLWRSMALNITYYLLIPNNRQSTNLL